MRPCLSRLPPKKQSQSQWTFHEVVNFGCLLYQIMLKFPASLKGRAAMTDRTIPPTPEKGNDISTIVYSDLMALREAKGLSLKDIYESTRISVSNLSAIENGQYHILPAPAYSRMFIRNYARAIGADSGMLLAAYDKYLQSLAPPVGHAKETERALRSGGGYGKWILWLLPATIAAIAILAWLLQYNQTGQEIAPTKHAPSVHMNQGASLTSPAPAAMTGQAVAPTPPSLPTVQTAPDAPPEVRRDTAKPVSMKKYNLYMEARENVWIRIRENGAPSEQMVLQAGQTLERSADEPLTVDIGNAGGIDVVFQGKPIGSIGKRGQVVHLRFPED
jgi:cytoskeletal protein RodZ